MAQFSHVIDFDAHDDLKVRDQIGMPLRLWRVMYGEVEEGQHSSKVLILP